MSNCLVSVIIPNYNHAQYLDLRIQSILNQTYQNFELIILDDNSPDNGASCRVIEKYRSNSHVSHVVYNEVNSGSTFKQWDKGINLAKGELIWIAESDDFCEPNLLELLVREFERDEKLTLAYTLLKNVDVEGKPISYYCRTPSGITRLNGHEYVCRYMTTCNHCANASAALFRKDAYQHMDRLYTTYKAGGDMLFWIEIAEQGNVAIVNQRLNYFRQHQVKVTAHSSQAGINWKEYKKTFEYIIEHFQLSNLRSKIMYDFVVYSLFTESFASEQTRIKLLSLWGVHSKLSLFSKMKIKVLLVLQNRLQLYF